MEGLGGGYGGEVGGNSDGGLSDGWVDGLEVVWRWELMDLEDLYCEFR